MRRVAFAIIWLVGACGMASAQSGTLPASALENFPHVAISNGLITAQIYPPGEKELYQGTRFDHAGVVFHVTYKGQDYSTYWFDHFVIDPRDETKYPAGAQHACCAVSGPVEEFGPVGFEEAGLGGRFLKPGVGIVQRTGDKYSQFPTLPVLNAGTRGFTASKNSAHFTQALQDKESGYGYSYAKTVSLVPGNPQMTIAHTLKNTGTKPINTTVYNHNFLTLSPGNENVVISAPFAIQADEPLQPELARIDDRTLHYLAPVPQGVSVQSPISGYGSAVADYDFRVVNTKTGFGQRLRADRPLARINFWSMNTVLGWEPYIAIALEPGESMSWTNTYDFFGAGEK